VGNIFLPIAIVITVYQESLWVGLAASIVRVLLAALIVTINLLGRLIQPRPESECTHDDIKADDEPGNMTPQNQTKAVPPGQDIRDAAS
jgi:hypothetical protein